MPDYVLMLDLELRRRVSPQQAEYRRRGGQFIMPVPVPEVLEVNDRWRSNRAAAPHRRRAGHDLAHAAPHRPALPQFGEIYFSTIYPGVVKGWHLHEEMTLNYACVVGRIKLVVYDDREESPTRGELDEIFLGPDSLRARDHAPGRVERLQGHERPARHRRQLLHAPARPDASRRLDPFDNEIPYDWRPTALTARVCW